MEQQINLYQPILGAGNPLFSARNSAIALGVFGSCLLAISGFAAARLATVEREVSALEQQQQQRLAATDRTLATLTPGGGLAAAEADVRQLATEVAEREALLTRLLDGATDATSLFSEQLVALGRQRPEGLWLERIVLSSHADGLLLAGATLETGLVPQYLDALAAEQVFRAARFERFQMRLPAAGEPAAAAMFEIGAAPARTGQDGPAAGGAR